MNQTIKIIETGTDELIVTIKHRVGTITLNKPDKRNALGDLLTPALRNAILDLDERDEVGCILITGAGDAFCAGGDIGGMGATPDAKVNSKPKSKQARIEDLTEKQKTLTQRLYETRTITVAALPGAAAGAGLSIALACDLRVIADSAFITTAFKNIGLSGDYGGSWFLPRLIGLSRAKQLYYSSERITAAEGLAMGLFNKVLAKQTFPEQAFAYAEAIANGPTEAFRRMKTNLQTGLDSDLGESLKMEAGHMVESFGTAESREAISAFMEKRKPVFHKPD